MPPDLDKVSENRDNLIASFPLAELIINLTGGLGCLRSCIIDQICNSNPFCSNNLLSMHGNLFAF